MKSIKNTYLFTAGIALVFGIASCKHDPPKPAATVDPASTQYPIEVANILVSKCATAGCHNAASYTFAGGLRLDDWNYLFDGAGTGAVAIPYSPENSSLLFFLNPSPGEYDELSVKPTMPYNEDPLSREEYNIIKDWIVKGAPDKNGNIPFASNAATRQKIYLTLQGCDLVAVIDAEKRVVMRYIKVGASTSEIEAPHFIQIDKKGEYAYICFTGGRVIQKIDCRTDQIVAEMNIGEQAYNIVQVSDNGEVIASQLLGGGRLILGDVSAGTYRTIARLQNPHGIAPTRNFDTFFVTGQTGNTIYKVDRDGEYEMISLDGKTPRTNVAADNPDPHEIMMVPDYSKYFVTCEKTHDVRVMDAYGDTLLKVIKTGIKPQELAMSRKQPYMFVTCMEDISKVSALYRGSVYVINYNTLEVVKRIDGEFYQPHGVAIDDMNDQFYVASLNLNTDGPAPHHISNCGGRNGYYQVYDLNMLERKDRKTYEVPPSPYSMQTRFRFP